MALQELDRLYHCVFKLQYHLILVTKYRRPCITMPMLERLRQICAEVAGRWGCRLVEFNGEADHVHLLLELTPRVAAAAFVNNLKTVSSRLIRKEFAGHVQRFYRKSVFWSRSYCIVSVGGAPLSVLKQYIERQGRPD